MPHKFSKESDFAEFRPAALEILDSPPSPVSRILMFTIILFFSVAVTWSIWGKVDVIVSGQGKVIPTGQVKTVQSLEGGVITEILVAEGEKVFAGQPVLRFDPTDTESSVAILEAQRTVAQVNAAVAQSLLKNLDVMPLLSSLGLSATESVQAEAQVLSTRTSFQAAVEELHAEVSVFNAQLSGIGVEEEKLKSVIPIMEERMAASGTLLRRDAVREDDRLALKQNLTETKALLASLDETRLQTDAQIQSVTARIRQLEANFLTQQTEELRQANAQIKDLDQQIVAERQRRDYRELKAPIGGIVDQVNVFTIGGVVGPGEVVMNVVPEQSDIEIEAMILNKDIGFVKPGATAEIKLEAFPFTKYGVLDGQITKVSSDALNHETFGLVYKINAKLTTSPETLSAKSISISSGMNATVEIQTDKRRVIDYFISPLLRYQDEAIRER